MIDSIPFCATVIRSNFARSRYPYKLNLAVTYRCNSKCMFCNIWKKPLQQELGADDFSRFFAHSNFFKWVHLTGGEIFLREDLTDIILSVLKKMDSLYLLQFSTNGYLTDRIVSAIDYLLTNTGRLPRILVGISIDGPENLHDRIRGIKDAFSHSVSTIKALRKIRQIKTYIGLTVSHLNAHLIDDTYYALKQHISDLKYDDLKINIVNKSEHYYENITNNDVQEALSDTDILINGIRHYQMRQGFSLKPEALVTHQYLNGTIRYLKSKTPPLPCQALSASCFVDPYGDIYPCAFWKKKIGNINRLEDSLSAIWQESEFCSIRHAIRHNSCPVCWTSCEAYPSILASLWRIFAVKMHLNRHSGEHRNPVFGRIK